MKQCNECGETKEFSEFYASSRMTDGFRGQCKSCAAICGLARKRTKKGLVANIFSEQKQSSKKRGHIPPTYTLYGLRQWFKSNAAANALYDAWKLSGYAKNLRPSVDRKDDNYGYSIDNIQLMTWGENEAKGNADKKSGKMKKCSNVAVIQMTKQGAFMAEYHSAAEAERVVGVAGTNITKCCKGKAETCGGFKWKHKEIEC